MKSERRLDLAIEIIQDLITNDQELSLGLLDVLEILASQQLQIAAQRRMLDRLLAQQSSQDRSLEIRFDMKSNGGIN